MVPRGVCPYRPSGGASGDGASNGDAICLTSFVVIHPRLRQRVSMFEAGVCGHHQSMAPRRCLTRLSEPRGGYTGGCQAKAPRTHAGVQSSSARSPCAADHQCGKLGQQVAQAPINKSGSVVGKVNHQIRLPRWRTLRYQIRADTGAKIERWVQYMTSTQEDR